MLQEETLRVLEAATQLQPDRWHSAPTIGLLCEDIRTLQAELARLRTLNAQDDAHLREVIDVPAELFERVGPLFPFGPCTIKVGSLADIPCSVEMDAETGGHGDMEDCDEGPELPNRAELAERLLIVLLETSMSSPDVFDGSFLAHEAVDAADSLLRRLRS